ncbi:hypothetical protein like AT5G66600 [Hibiscus trionum]|uniref:Ternary complex factor MIP1 leucine-zipper domain-containing protein n=1 Tax=Hibiscus trionum TaxID=183268 RepID=A0A9W7H3X3_HIBTR|nr:hypothetical protein like AT5G66600 [Hibiscus trionum]
MSGVKWRGVHLNQLEFMEETTHKRSNSVPLQKKVKKNKLNSIFEASNRHKEMGGIKGHVEAKIETSNIKVRNSLKQEILQLEERLQDQFVVRSTLEKALSNRPFTYDAAVENLIPKDAKELIKDIAVLELEVAHLEKYLLSLYRKKFDKTFLSLKSIDENLKPTSMAHKEMFQEDQIHDIMSEEENLVIQSGNLVSSRKSIGNLPKECNNVWGSAKLLDSSIYRSHSSLSQQSVYSVNSPQQTVAKAVEQYHSLPLSMLEQAQMDTSNGLSLAEHCGVGINNHVTETPNWLSEEMIKSISAIYCELADPPLINYDYSSSPLSHSSYVDVPSRGQGDTNTWSPKCGKFSSFNSHFDNPFSIGEPKEYSGPYCTMVKVQWICRDSKKLQDIEHKLQYYRSLVYQLEEVDVRRMKHEEKLAFWINVHNSLVMHAFLVYGIPKNNLKRLSLLLKAAYDVGGKTISIDTIQSSILGCRLPRPGQWLRFLFPSKTKFKVGDSRRASAIESPEPLLHFALCSGSYSDPVVRIYTPKEVFQELEVAKEDYIQANWSINKEQKIMLPKLMEYFAKDSNVCIAGLLQMVEQFMPDSLRKNVQPSCKRKTGKNIEWISHNFAFRYIFSKELTQ